MSKASKMRKETKLQGDYQDYLDETGGVKKSSMTYYQWKDSKGLIKGKKLKRKKKEGRMDSQRKTLEDALSPEEIKRLGY